MEQQSDYICPNCSSEEWNNKSWTIDPETAKMCQQMASGYKDLPKERVWGEWEKLLTKGKDYSAMFDYLKQTGWGQFFPEVGSLVGTPQEYEWHPEGCVATHTAHVMNAARKIADREGLTGFRRLLLMTGALTHDFAKPSTTQQMEKGGVMRWTSHGHEKAGGPMVKEFLSRLGAPKELVRQVVPLVENHLAHINYKGTSTDGMIRQFAHDISPAKMSDMALLFEADHSGRPPLPEGLPDTALKMIELAKSNNVYDDKPQRIIEGKDVMPYYNGVGSPAIGQAVQDAYNAYLQGRYTTREEGLGWLDNYMRQRASLLRGEHVLPYFGGKGNKEVGNIINTAWQAQRAGEFADEEGAKAWLDTHMRQKQPVAPPVDAPATATEV